jgi:acetyltransferase
MFLTDLSKETYGAILSSGKPLGICLYGLAAYMHQVKLNVNFPIFNSPEEMVRALAFQRNYYAKKRESQVATPALIDTAAAGKWLEGRDGNTGEDSLELLKICGIPVAESGVAKSAGEAVKIADGFGYPVVMKVVSPDALHKTDAGGVMVGVKGSEEAKRAFETIQKNLVNYKKDARFEGVRVQRMIGDGHDMFIGGKYDISFGPVVVFGFGGIFVEVFGDVSSAVCPVAEADVRRKLAKLKSFTMLKGFRGMPPADIDGYTDAIVRVSHLLAAFPGIKELDVNPLRLLSDGSGICALDARMRVER